MRKTALLLAVLLGPAIAAGLVAKAVAIAQAREDVRGGTALRISAAEAVAQLSALGDGVRIFCSETPSEAEATQVRLRVVPRGAGSLLMISGSF